jgi:hypothetical protein
LSLLLRIPAFRNAYLIRGLIVWGGLRLALAWGNVRNPNAALEVLVLGVVGLAVLLDARRRSEDLFLGNLGIPAIAIAVCARPLAAVAELLVP